MWRWGQRTVRNVGGFAQTALGYRTHHDPRRLAGSGNSGARSTSLHAGAAMTPSVSPRTLRHTQDLTAAPSIQVVGTTPPSLPDTSVATDVHIVPPAHDATVIDRHVAPTNAPACETQLESHLPSKVAPDPRLLSSEIDASCSGTSSLLDELRMALSMKPLEIVTRDLSTDRIRYLYLALRKRTPLLPHEYSALISLFGSLSLSKPGKPYRSVYGHPLTNQMEQSYGGSYWDMIGLVAKDKRDYGLTDVVPSDRYWLMRLDAEALKAPASVDQGSSVSTERRLQRIDINYALIPGQPSIDVHVPYLEAIFSSQADYHIEAATVRLRKLIIWYHGCPPALVSLLLRLALKPPAVAQASFKAAVLDAIWCRLIDSSHESTDESSTEVARSACGVTVPLPRNNASHPEPTSAVDLLPMLRGVIFNRPQVRAEPAGDWSSWALSVARKVFSPDHLDESSIEHRWSCLALLAAASSPRAAPASANLTHSFAMWAAVVDWRTICALAYLHSSLRSKERLLGVPFSEDIVERLGEMLRTLWDHWAGLPALDHVVRPRAVTRAICTSFLHMAGRLKNRGVIEACRRFCDVRCLWYEDHSTSTSLHFLVQEQLIALLVSGSDPEVAVATTLESTQEESLLSAVFSAVIITFTRENVELATEVQQVARRIGIKLSLDSSAEVAVHQAKQGELAPALGCLSQTELSPEQRLRILRTVLEQLVWRGHRFRSTRLTPDAINSLLAHFASSSPSNPFPSDLASVLLVMPRHQHAKPAVTLVEAIAKADRTHLSPKFFNRFIRNLVRHRQLRIAARTHHLAQKLYPESALPSYWLAAQLSKHGASMLAQKFAGSMDKAPEKIRVLRAVKFRERSPSPVRTLKLSRLLHPRRTQRQRRLRTDAAIHRALEILIRAARLRSVKRLYSELRATQSPSSLNALGNSILHASTQRPSRSQADRWRQALTMLNELVEKYAFTPDRVTINTLVKAYMQWTAGVTHEHLRALFDHIVRTGYPTGDVIPQGRVPFGTAEGPPPIYLPEVDTPLSYAKHVRPLYKMFIKAFYRRGDVGAVRVVVGIMKAVEAERVDARIVDALRVGRKRRR